MAGMALLLVFAVTQDESGWTASDRDGQHVARPDRTMNDQPITRPGRVDLPGALPANIESRGPAAASFRGEQGWAEFEDALSRPIDRTAPRSDNYTGLRRAQGIDNPPQPPSFGPPPERGRVREWLDEEAGRRPRDTGQFRSEVDEPATRPRDIAPRDIAPRDMMRQPRERQRNPDDGLIDVPDLAPDRRRRERDLLYEERMAENDRRYLVPPSREYDDRGVTPVPFTGREERPINDDSTTALPSVDLPLSAPNNFAREEEKTGEQPARGEPSPSDGQGQAAAKQSAPTDSVDDPQDSATPERSSWPLMLAMVGLFGSLGFNVYLGWIAWDIHGRYQDVIDEVKELENRLDQQQPRSEPSDTRRIRA